MEWNRSGARRRAPALAKVREGGGPRRMRTPGRGWSAHAGPGGASGGRAPCLGERAGGGRASGSWPWRRAQAPGEKGQGTWCLHTGRLSQGPHLPQQNKRFPPR